MTERSPKERWREAEATVPVARSSSTELAPASVAVPILERRRRATNLQQPARVTLLTQATQATQATHATREEPRSSEEPRSWDRARWVNEVRRFDTAWDVDAPRSTGSSRAMPVAPASARELARSKEPLTFPTVTLVVYEWQNAEPGTLSWQFQSLEAAVAAARAIRNAVRWAVVAGAEPNLARARELGLVLAEPEPVLGKL